MVVLIILNIILIVLLTIMSIYFFRNNKNKYIDKCVCINDYKHDKNNGGEHIHRKKVKTDRVFVGRFIDDEEYQQMMCKRRSDISILLEDVNRGYEYLKQLNNERTEGNNPR